MSSLGDSMPQTTLFLGLFIVIAIGTEFVGGLRFQLLLGLHIGWSHGLLDIQNVSWLLLLLYRLLFQLLGLLLLGRIVHLDLLHLLLVLLVGQLLLRNWCGRQITVCELWLLLEFRHDSFHLGHHRGINGHLNWNCYGCRCRWQVARGGHDFLLIHCSGRSEKAAGHGLHLTLFIWTHVLHLLGQLTQLLLLDAHGHSVLRMRWWKVAGAGL